MDLYYPSPFPVGSLANVDPIDVARNITGLNPETTLGKVLYFFCLVKNPAERYMLTA